MARARTATPSPADPSSEEDTPEALQVAPDPAPPPPPTPAAPKQRGGVVTCKVKHGQLFAGADTYHQTGAVLQLPVAEAENLVALGVVTIVE